MHVLYTTPYTFHKVLTGRIYLTIKNFFIFVTLKHDSGVTLEIRCYEVHVLLGDQFLTIGINFLKTIKTS